jgi:predicted nucleic acid-binding protein
VKVFIDSSALAKRYIREPGSEKVEKILGRASSLGLSSLCPVEIISAMCRRRRELSLTKDQYLLAKQALVDDARDAEIVNVVPRVVGKAIAILEKEALRTIDAIHIGSALEWKASLFVSSDKKQVAAASRAGLKTELV